MLSCYIPNPHSPGNCPRFPAHLLVAHACSASPPSVPAYSAAPGGARSSEGHDGALVQAKLVNMEVGGCCHLMSPCDDASIEGDLRVICRQMRGGEWGHKVMSSSRSNVGL